ncbi:hypothetical protein N7492_005792 [Penicillium capsulatum]|uniref:Karyogamy protein, KAR9 n=1 Tax=Penicillium capsulatum TaxID=69766 RepID=A0A9W9LRC6_9EURO|nr:hypothetical protein N7492_005792 [Penicillium capsulatum]KAJ6135108.1 hypothetical protein N7512_000268 [Penicillium capsulatum]
MHATVDGPTSSATDIVTTPVLSASSPGSPNDSGPSPLRRLKSKSSLWSLGSSNHDDDPAQAESSSADQSAGRQSIFRRLSPSLAARVKHLDSSAKVTSAPRNANAVGRIPEKHLKELDSLHRDLSIKVEKKGQAWNGSYPLDPQIPSRSASNKLELPSPDFLREASRAREQGSDHTDALVDSPEPFVLAAAEPPVTVPGTEAHASSPASMSVAEPVSAPPRADQPPDPLPNHDDRDTRTDFEKFVDETKRSEEQSTTPAPPPKDTPPENESTYTTSSNNNQSYFNPRGLQRPESIYSFSRASFSNQLSQLTSVPLPQPGALEASIEKIPTSLVAVRALTGAAEQIQIWIRKASDVLNGLDAEDDVEWAAAGGREGLDGVDKAITTFESLVNVYVKAIDNVQRRDDIANVDSENLRTIVTQMESILKNWATIKSKLGSVKEQVELAMEWEELWSNVLGDVGKEIDDLSAMIFQMEEQRHQALEDPDTNSGLDISELETIVEESPTKGRSPSGRLNIAPTLAAASDTPIIKTPQDDTSQSNLMALFARMQPLRASLDFLPMRLAMFATRGEAIFPSACEELDERKDRLEKTYGALRSDAEALRKELSEDKWVIVFRKAGSQAQKMFDSVERSISKLQEGLETNAQVHNPATLTKLVENYEAKKIHYVPAIERVISIISKGVQDRLTVNGRVIRLLSDMESRTNALKASLKVMDASLEDVQIVKGQHLRDSISSIMTMDSPATGSAVDTPGSSPASSVIVSGNGHKNVTTPLGGSSRRESSVGSATSRSTVSKARRASGLPPGAATLTGRKSSIPKPTGPAVTPTPASRVSRVPQPSPIPNRPKWNGSTNTSTLDTGHNFKPLSATTPSAYRKSSLPNPSPRPSSTLPFRRDMAASPMPGSGRPTSRLTDRLASSSRSPARNASPSPGRSSLLDPPPYSRLRRPSGMDFNPRSRQSFAGVSTNFSRSVSQAPGSTETPSRAARPGTALGHSTNRRVSLLPLPTRPEKERTEAQRKLDARPRWRA